MLLFPHIQGLNATKETAFTAVGGMLGAALGLVVGMMIVINESPGPFLVIGFEMLLPAMLGGPIGAYLGRLAFRLTEKRTK